MQQGIDSRAMFATYMIKLPGLLILAVAGAILGSGLNLFVALSRVKDICYVSETEYCIEFAEGRFEARDHYNAFTWNDVLVSDLILGRAMELLGSGFDRNQVRTMISSEMLSDVRYLTVFVRGQEPAQVEEIKDAVGTALEEFGLRNELFDRIYKIDDLDITREEAGYFGWRAALLGAVTAAGAGAFATAFCFCMGSVFYTKADIRVRLGLPVCGMTFREGHGRDGVLERRQAEMLAGNLKMLAETYPRILLMDASGGQEAELFLRYIRERGMADGASFQVHDATECADGLSAIVAVIPFGKPYREKIADEIDCAQLRGGRVVSSVLTQSDRMWMRIYYACAGAGKE